ncbi:MAG: DUF6702 family protein [Longimicrobiales bacterium]
MRRRPAGLAPTLALALGLLPLLPTPGGGAAPDSAANPKAATVAHDLRIAYADMAIEGAVVAGRVRLFKDDLERALGPMVGADAFTLRLGSEADALVMRYLRDHLTLEVAGATLEPTLLQSGQDMLDREPVWWVIVQYQATATIDTLRVRNTLLFDVFDDQRNIMKFVRFPEETQKTFYFDEDEAEHVVAF